MGHKVGIAREQIEMMFCLDEMVSKDSPARQIDAFVNVADTSYFARTTVKNTGCPPYNPKDMLKLYIYGMENGIVSSRKLEREAKRNDCHAFLIIGRCSTKENLKRCSF